MSPGMSCRSCWRNAVVLDCLHRAPRRFPHSPSVRRCEKLARQAKPNRLPHPLCKPLHSKEGGADGFVCRAAGINFSHLRAIRSTLLVTHSARSKIPKAFKHPRECVVTREDIQTPALLVDLDRMETNLE